MNYRRILMAAVFILYIHWEKRVKNMTSWRHKTLSASAIRKQVSRYCIHFPLELTCQILTNQSIKLDEERDQRVTMVRKVKSDCLPCM